MTPLYGWKGPGEMREITHQRTKRPEIRTPTTPELQADDVKEKRYQCAVEGCGRKFKKAMIVARHFNSSHDELRTDSNSWREFSKEVWE